MNGTNHTIWMPARACVEIRESEIPSPAPGEVLIRTHRTLISTGTELAIFHDDAVAGSAWNEFARFPRRMGYSSAGHVVDTAEGVPRDWIGKRVASRGCHAAWITRPLTDLRAIPDAVSDEEATFSTLAAVVMHGLRRVAFTWGETVAVFGLGIVGQLCVRLSEAAGASRIFAIERSPFRVGLLPAAPHIHGFNADDTSWMDALSQAADLAVEATGSADLIPCEIQALRDQGRLLLLSSPSGATSFHFHEMCNRRSISIVGAHGFSQPKAATPDNPWTSQRHGELFLDWIAAGRVSVGKLVTHHFPFHHAAGAYALLADRRTETLAVIFDWDTA